MRVAFAGTPAFAARALEALAAARHDIALVLTQPDRPRGRGLRLVPSAVSDAARSLGLAVFQPETLRDERAQARLREAAPEVLVVAAYGLILPQAVLDIPPRGCLNIHASLLPRWRGAAPIQRALLAGDERTGVCIMRMEAGLDTGPVLLERPIGIGARDTAGTLTERLAALGAEAIVEALARLDRLEPRPQDAGAATYAAKVAKEEALIDWTRPAVQLDRLVRAFDPVPGAETTLDGERLKIWRAEPASGKGSPGEVLEASGDRLRIACGEGALAVRELQRAGGKRLATKHFLQGLALAPGRILGTPRAIEAR